MDHKITKIQLSLASYSDQEQNSPLTKGTVDVIVEFSDGSIHVASFFTYESLYLLNMANKKSGSFLGGKYFWAEQMLFAEDIAPETIEMIVCNLIEEGDFETAFKKL